MPEESPREPEDHSFLLESKPFWRDVLEQLHDAILPSKEPDLHLESRPIPVKDIWEPPQPLRSRLGSIAVHLAVVGILLLPFWRPVQIQVKKALTVAEIYVPPKAEPPLPRFRRLAGGGAPLVQPKLQLPQTPKPQPVMAPTSMIPLQNALIAPTFGSIGPIAGPPGAGGGSGGGPGGTGKGEGGGDCVGANCGEGEAAASQPVPIYSPDPEYSDAARRAKFQGTCLVQVTIGADGRVSHPVVIQPLGLGLDQKAIQAVLLWRFRPARDKSGRAIAVTAQIQVNFRLF